MRIHCCRRVGFVLLLTQVVGCVAWSVRPVSPVQLINDEGPDRVRLTNPAGSQLVLWQPFVRSDSIIGQTELGETPMAVADIRTVAVRRVDPLRTGLLIVGVPVVALFGAFLYFIAACGSGGCSS